MGNFVHGAAACLLIATAIAPCVGADQKPKALSAGEAIRLGAKNMPDAIPANQIRTDGSSPKMLRGMITQSALPVSMMYCPYGIWYMRETAQSLPGRITHVEPGSPAWSAGIRDGDRLLSGVSIGGVIKATIQRNGRTYEASIRFDALKLGKELVGQALQQRKHLPPVPNPTKILKQFDVVVMIDYSGSMATLDCPGDISRWDWCGRETTDLAQQASAAGGSGIEFVTFDHSAVSYPHAKASDVSRIFSTKQPGGGTFLGEVMKRRLQAYLSQRSGFSKPLVIAVITDGDTHDQAVMERAILDAAGQVHKPNEINICFLQVGDDIEGGKQLISMQANLEVGAKNNIASYRTFDEIKQIGLTQALVQILASKL